MASGRGLPVYLVNLARRPDRLEAMTRKLSALGLSATRIDAVDASAADEAALAAFVRPEGPLGPMPAGDRGCTASHFLAWEALIESGAPAAVVLEDDVELAPDFAAFCGDVEWVPGDALAVKLDKFSPRPSRKLLGARALPAPGGRALRRLHSRHAGGAAYLLTRRGAEALLPLKGSVGVPVDHLLFSPNVSEFACGPVYQLLPAAARQDPAAGSDIVGGRRRKKPLALRARRLFYEMNRLPSQALRQLSGRARWIEVEFVSSGGGGR